MYSAVKPFYTVSQQHRSLPTDRHTDHATPSVAIGCIHTVFQKTSTFLFFEQLCHNWPILMIFGMLNPERIWHDYLTHLFTSPARCSHFTLGNPKKSQVQQYCRRKMSTCMYRGWARQVGFTDTRHHITTQPSTLRGTQMSTAAQ